MQKDKLFLTKISNALKRIKSKNNLFNNKKIFFVFLLFLLSSDFKNSDVWLFGQTYLGEVDWAEKFSAPIIYGSRKMFIIVQKKKKSFFVFKEKTFHLILQKEK